MPRTIVVKGTSGAGKSTFAAELASRLGLPYIELDALHWGPNWSAATPDEFRTRVEAVLAAMPDGWVVDGNYDSKLGEAGCLRGGHDRLARPAARGQAAPALASYAISACVEMSSSGMATENDGGTHL